MQLIEIILHLSNQIYKKFILSIIVTLPYFYAKKIVIVFFLKVLVCKLNLTEKNIEKITVKYRV